MLDKTHTEELIEHLLENSPSPTPTEYVKKVYDAFDTTDMVTGIQYYLNKNDILKRKMYTYIDGVKVVDLDATNERIPSGFHKILVDQKAAYLAGEPMVFSSRTGNQAALELIETYIGSKWEDTLPELVKNASNKGTEWLHPFVNEDGDFDYIVIPAENFIPIRNTKTGKLLAGIHFYNESDDLVRLAVWTDTDVTYYVMDGGDMSLDGEPALNPAPHFSNDDALWGTWGRVPFIEFMNNNERVSDLSFYKEAIDAYDLLVSDAQNTLQDMQTLIWALKGYTGEDLSEFMDNLKRYKAVSLDLEGGLETIRAEVPVDAYMTHTDKLEKNIYAFGEGVNPSPEVIGAAPSGVALKNLYSLLDMKASIMERKFAMGINELMEFISIYCEASGKGEFDYKDITFTFNKLLLTNEVEVIQMARDSVGVISEATILENHPWVKDVVAEQKRIEKERAAAPPVVDVNSAEPAPE